MHCIKSNIAHTEIARKQCEECAHRIELDGVCSDISRQLISCE